MTFTINVPVFPLRKEINARRRRLSLCMGLPLRGSGKTKEPEPRYTADGLEFDVTDLGRPARGPKGN